MLHSCIAVFVYSIGAQQVSRTCLFGTDSRPEMKCTKVEAAGVAQHDCYCDESDCNPGNVAKVSAVLVGALFLHHLL